MNRGNQFRNMGTLTIISNKSPPAARISHPPPLLLRYQIVLPTPIPHIPIQRLMKRKRTHDPRHAASAQHPRAEHELRIIGGTFRGSTLRYPGAPRVRPMKHRVREAIFNLISTDSEGRHALDLFAGSGALGLEALSRGAATATFIEQHVPSSRVVQENIARLGVEARTSLLVTSAFLWAKRDLPHVTGQPHVTGEPHIAGNTSAPHGGSPISLSTDRPWLVFCSPPYAFYSDRETEMLDLIDRLAVAAPGGSILVIEADERFDFGKLTSPEGVGGNSQAADWNVRTYSPAVVGIGRLPG